jgi:hypothetical protein
MAMNLLSHRAGRHFAWLKVFEAIVAVRVKTGRGDDTILVVSPKAPMKKVKRTHVEIIDEVDFMDSNYTSIPRIIEYEEEVPDYPVKTAREWLEIIESGKLGSVSF